MYQLPLEREYWQRKSVNITVSIKSNNSKKKNRNEIKYNNNSIFKCANIISEIERVK